MRQTDGAGEHPFSDAPSNSARKPVATISAKVHLRHQPLYGARDWMLIGYARASKVVVSQSRDLQRDVLANVGIQVACICVNRALGQRDNRPGPTSCPKALQPRSAFGVVEASRPPPARPEAPCGRIPNWAGWCQTPVKAGVGAETGTTTAKGPTGLRHLTEQV